MNEGGHVGTLLRYWDALDSGRAEEACRTFADDVVFGRPVDVDNETGPRDVLRGRNAVRSFFIGRGVPTTRHVATTLFERDGVVLVDGYLARDGAGAFGCFAVRADFDADGLVARYLAYAGRGCIDAVTPRVAVDTSLSTPPGGSAATAMVATYFEHLEAGQFDAAAACFTDDIIYSHPPYRHSGITEPGRAVFLGRAELLAAFERRGRRPFRHVVDELQRMGDRCLFQGRVINLPDGGSGSFLSSAMLASDGRIARYVSYYCEPTPF